MYFSIKDRYIDILLKKKTTTLTSFISVCFAAITLVIVLAWFLRRQRRVMSASGYQRSSLYIKGQIPRNSEEWAGAVLIGSRYLTCICV